MEADPSNMSRGSQSARGGHGDTFSSESLASDYETRMRSDACAISTNMDFNDAVEDYVLWLPKYRQKTCESSGYLNCSPEGERFGPRQITQESFLQGRGQVTSNPNCSESGLRYLPQSEFPEPKPRKTDMALFALPTVAPRSCGTVTETDMTQRMEPLPGAWQGAWSPFAGMKFVDDSINPREPVNAMKAQQTVSLGSKNKYPSWPELKAASDPYSR